MTDRRARLSFLVVSTVQVRYSLPFESGGNPQKVECLLDSPFLQFIAILAFE